MVAPYPVAGSKPWDVALKAYIDSVAAGAGGAVSSVNTKTGAVVLTQDDVADGTTAKQYTSTEKAKLAGLPTTAAPTADPTFTGVTTVSGFRMGMLSKSADYTVLANDPSFIAVTTGASNITMTLPSTVTAGTVFIIKKVDAGAGQVNVGGIIDGFTTPALVSQYDWMWLVATGTTNNYHLVSSNKPKTLQAASTDLGVAMANLGLRSSGSTYTLSTSGSVAFSGGFAALANLRLGAKAISAAYTITTSDPIYILANATTAAFVVTLPSTTTSGITYLIKKTDSTANAVTMTSMFDGQAGTTITLGTRGDYVMIESTSTADQWIVVGSNRPMPGQQQGATVDLGVVLSNLGLRGSGTAYPITTSGALGLTGSTRFGQRNISSGTTLSSSTDPYFITVDGTTTAFNLTLPTATTVGQTYSIKKSDSVNPVTIVGTIDGATNLVLTSKDDFVTVVSAGGGGSAWRIVARSAPNLIPSYVVAPALLRKDWDGSTGLYNFNARTMRRARAGLAKAAAGGFARVLCFGDSTFIGYDGATTEEAKSVPRKLGATLAALTGAPLGGGMVPWTVNTTSMVSTGTVDRAAYPGLMTMYPGSTVTYTPVLPFTSHDLTYSNQSATFGVQIDGGAAVNPAVTGAGTMTKATTHTGLADTVHTIKITAGSNFAYIALSDLKRASGIHLTNLCVGGTTADLIGSGYTSWANTAAAPTLKTSLIDGYQTLAGYDPDLIVIPIGGNDLFQGDTNAHAIAGAKKMKDFFPNASCLMVQGWRIGSVAAATANDYLERKYQLADQYDFALQDLQFVSGTYEEATALGMVGPDTVHPSFATQGQWGRSGGTALAAA